MTTLALEREGEFEAIAMQETSNRCGRVGGMNFKYAVRIEGTDEKLSPEGYLIENGRIHTYFLRHYGSSRPWKAISCEQMAAKAARQIGEKLMAEGISVTAVECTIIGSNSTRLKARWEAPKPIYLPKGRLVDRVVY